MAKPTTTNAALHIFKPGTHTAMSGMKREFTAADLAASAAAYDPALHEAPIVVGHPQHDMPAYGWVQRVLHSEGDGHNPPGLYAQVGQVNADFADMVAAGAFKKISAAFYPPDAPSNPKPGVFYLRHVGFLGAQPPAIKGLAQVAFADGNDPVVFAQWDEPAAPAADPSAPEIEPEPTPADPAPADPAPASPLPDDPPPTPELETPVTPEEKAAVEAKAAAVEAENQALRAELAAQKRNRVHEANAAFAEKLAAEGRLLPAYKDLAVATLDHFALLDQPVEFGEGEAKKPLADQLRAMLAAAPQAVAFGEQATTARAAATDAAAAAADDDAAFAEGAEPERLAQHKAIKAHMAQHKVDYATAARAVLK